MELLGVASIVLALVSTTVAVVAYRRAGEAETIANAARTTAAEALSRSAAAHETLADEARLGRERAEREPPWRVVVGAKPRYVIRNDGPEDAVDVDLDVQGAVQVRNAQRRDRIPAGGQVEIHVHRAWQSGAVTLAITWSRPDDSRRLGPWTVELPRQP